MEEEDLGAHGAGWAERPGDGSGIGCGGRASRVGSLGGRWKMTQAQNIAQSLETSSSVMAAVSLRGRRAWEDQCVDVMRTTCLRWKHNHG